MSGNYSWFRMHKEFCTDPKVQRLSEADQRRYVMILCMRCNDEETLHETLLDEMSNENVAFMLRISDEEWLKTKKVLMEKKLIDNNNLPTGWNKRQYRSDSSSARVAKHRAAKKEAEKNDVTGCNVSETAPDTYTDTQTDTQTYTDKKPKGFLKEELEVTNVTSCAEASSTHDDGEKKNIPEDKGNIFITLPCNGKVKEFHVYEADLLYWAELYPGVNIDQHFRTMLGWADANPGKRKTFGGMKSFINNWLSREQNKAGSQNNPYNGAKNIQQLGQQGNSSFEPKSKLQQQNLASQQAFIEKMMRENAG